MYRGFQGLTLPGTRLCAGPPTGRIGTITALAVGRRMDHTSGPQDPPAGGPAFEPKLTMNRILSLIPLIGLGTGLMVIPSQDTAQDPPAEEPKKEARRDIFGRQKLKAVGEEEGLEGMWQLLNMDVDGYPAGGLVPSGFLLISAGFMAFEMHAYYEEDGLLGVPFEDGFQTFFGEYDLNSGESLVCRSLIGSYLDEEEDDLEFEDPGTERNFEVELEDRMLTLKWGENDSMTFGRLRHTTAQLTDIYGRERGRRSLKGPDIFGREKTRKEEGEDGEEGSDG